MDFSIGFSVGLTQPRIILESYMTFPLVEVLIDLNIIFSLIVIY